MLTVVTYDQFFFFIVEHSIMLLQILCKSMFSFSIYIVIKPIVYT